jgi:hypothetical protein
MPLVVTPVNGDGVDGRHVLITDSGCLGVEISVLKLLRRSAVVSGWRRAVEFSGRIEHAPDNEAALAVSLPLCTMVVGPNHATAPFFSVQMAEGGQRLTSAQGHFTGHIWH